MRLVSFRAASGVRLGLVVGQEVVDLNAALYRRLVKRDGLNGSLAGRVAETLAPTDVGDFLALGTRGAAEAEAVAPLIATESEAERQALRREGVIHSLRELVFSPPLGAAATIFCVGRNYPEHVAEAALPTPSRPPIFLRTHASIVGHLQALVRPRVSNHFDWEGELAVVMGRPCRYVDPEDVPTYVAGYTIFNDGTVRDFQRHSPYIVSGKNFYRSGAMGPWITTPDEISDPQTLSIATRVSDEVMQLGSTAEMMFDVSAIVSYVSQFAALQPGDVIATGTPAGVGARRKPPRYLVPGEVLRIEIDGIGTLENPVVDEVDTAVVGG